ncbi:VOC family protein [Histidinibacterium aquaticum]|uniref:VOC family protein n=1 Tax=Histidinibacterium aquaticum TaxID=2613962 RepID=A0A5J5GKW1_9RHOB|nr:VOC family protein [Histidinibacterium aquaticum]KAA9008770.1 VOC family protein [Histidinibacterium aquaticum]
MDLGAFSISLAVKDIRKSIEFYEELGFTHSGNPEENWVIMKNGNHVIGLFQGMFEGNILTFNPGWDQEANELGSFTDIRELQRTLKWRGIELSSEANEETSGPASITLSDPDGNQILIDQHR